MEPQSLKSTPILTWRSNFNIVKYIVKFQIKQPKNPSSVVFQWDLVDSYKKTFPNILNFFFFPNLKSPSHFGCQYSWDNIKTLIV